MSKKLNTIELFAGAGGLLDGFEQTNKFSLLGAVEWLKPQCRTLVKRLENKYDMKDANKKVLNFDIQRTSELINGWEDDEFFGTHIGLNELIGDKEVDIISGGPPCQAYSLAGRIRDTNGMKEDYRNFLFESYLRVVDYYRPKIIVFENVEGILSAVPSGKLIVDLVREGFNEIGYEIVDDLRKYALLDLSEYGVPQKRKRVIIIGIRRDKDINYQEILEEFYTNILQLKKIDTKCTVKDAIGNLPPIYPLANPVGKKSHENNNEINGHKSRFHSERDQSIFHELAEDIENLTNNYNTSNSLIELYYNKTGKRTNVHKYHVLRWDKPSNTIPAHLKKDGLRHIHPDSKQKRSITVREAARIQTFEDDFEFFESMGANYEMIGNAVPPLFAKKLGLSVAELYDKLM